MVPVTTMFAGPYLRRGPLAAFSAALVVTPVHAQDPDIGRSPPIAVDPEYPPELAPPARVEFMQARRLADGGRHAEAAALLEGLARETGDTRLLYHAAIARARSGRPSLALQHLGRVRTRPELGDAARADIDAKIADAAAQQVDVRLDLRGPQGGAVDLAPGTRILLDADGVPQIFIDRATTLRLDPGPWTIHIEVPGYLPISRLQRADPGPGERVWHIVLVRKDPPPQVVQVEPPPPPPPPRLSKDPKLTIGVGAFMGVSFYSGIGLSLVGANRETKAEERNTELLLAAGGEKDVPPDDATLAALEADYPTAELHRDIRRAASLQTAGPVVMTAGLGMILGLLPSLFESKRRAAHIELGVGAATLVGGSVWMAYYIRRLDARLAPTAPANRVDSSGLGGHRVGASMILGMGIGLTIGTSLLLLTDHLRHRRRARTTLRLVPGLTGLGVRGEF
jgi:hypothetical protein